VSARSATCPECGAGNGRSLLDRHLLVVAEAEERRALWIVKVAVLAWTGHAAVISLIERYLSGRKAQWR
jgi:hypothetical protein